MATPHNTALEGQIAKTVLMPGDPLRAKFIAETFLEDAECFNTVRNMFGYTGTYKGHKVSVMGSGMGMGSIGIYSYELYAFYGVENIIRIGSAGGYRADVKLFDIVLADSAFSESSFVKQVSGYEKDVTYPSAELNNIIKTASATTGIPVIEGRIHSADAFYSEEENNKRVWKKVVDEMGCTACEMESFALFHNADILGKRAACLVTVSDNLVTHELTTAEQRQTAFREMMKVALETAVLCDK